MIIMRMKNVYSDNDKEMGGGVVDVAPVTFWGSGLGLWWDW